MVSPRGFQEKQSIFGPDLVKNKVRTGLVSGSNPGKQHEYKKKKEEI